MRIVSGVTAVTVTLGLMGARCALADNIFGADQGKLPLTAGFSDLDGAGGGGLVPLAFITGYGSSDSYGANTHFTNIQLRDFHLYTFGAAVGFLDRIEASYTREQLDI